MARHERIKSKSGYYHIMLRGNERRDIFHDDADKGKFIEILKEKKQGNSFLLHAFCLMDNHVHLMLSEGIEDVAKVMKRITVSYVYYFNHKYKRVGHLFQDRYKSEAIEDDSYLLALTRYIHQNPVKAGMASSADAYKWSSYRFYMSEPTNLVDTQAVLELFAEDPEVAKKRFGVYMNEEDMEEFMDIKEDVEVMEETAAKELFGRMLGVYGNELQDRLVKEFKEKTNLPLRKIAAITGLNKDKVSKMLKT